MSNESEFKPFTLTDFTVIETPPEETENTPDSEESAEASLAERLADFRPLTFTEEDSSLEIAAENFDQTQGQKTDAEKIELSEKFKTGDFVHEDSLLTNAESYAESIREGARLYKTQLLTKIEETAADTERIRQEAQAANQAAEQERIRMLEAAEKEVEKIKTAAYQEGFEAGRVQGMQQRYDEAEPLARQVNAVFEQLSSLRQVVRFQAEQELVQLALQIAKNVVIEEVTVNPKIIQNIVQAALHEIEVQGKIYLHLHPDDYQFLTDSKAELGRYMSDEQTLMLRQNPDLPPGSIHVESDEEVINSSFAEQFEKLEEKLSESLAERHAHLSEVDMDAHNFSAPPSGNGEETPEEQTEKTTVEITNSTPPETSETPETEENPE